MFFILSKILFFIIQPLNWIIGLLGGALIAKNPKRKRQLLRGGFWLFVLLSNPLIFNVVAHQWEYPPTAMHELRDTFDIGIVLGGFSSSEVETNDKRLNINQAGNRIIDVLTLYKMGKVKKILITGGDGKLIGKKSSEAIAVEPFLLAMGVRREDILLESNSRNTYENAFFTKQLFEKQALTNKKNLLVTSAYHIYRSERCFRKLGLSVTPFSAHFESEMYGWQPSKWITPEVKNFYRWEAFIKEWVGCVMYKLKGYN